MRREPRIDNPRYRADLCSLGCIICGGPAEPHHVRRLRADAGMAMRPGDDKALPICRRHHDAIHNQWGDEDAFWEAHGISDPLALAAEFYSLRGSYEAMWALWREVKWRAINLSKSTRV